MTIHPFDTQIRLDFPPSSPGTAAGETGYTTKGYQIVTVRAPVTPGDWLALGPASRVVGVDPDTLRRWSDAGRVEAYTTPGGHRRFSRAALERLVSNRRADRSTLQGMGATPERLAAAYRRSYGTSSAKGGTPAPRAAVRPPDREAYRHDGRRLVVNVLAYLDAPDDTARTTAAIDAEAVSTDLGRRIAGAGISLTEGVGLFVAGRRPFLSELGALARRRRLGSDQLSTLFESASALLDRLLLVFIETHRDATAALEGVPAHQTPPMSRSR